jgi:phosphate transport system permease protein
VSVTRPRSPQADPAGASGAKRRLLSDRAARYLLAAAAGFAVLVLLAVYAFVAGQSFGIFDYINPLRFLFVDHWTPYAVVPQGLACGHLSAGTVAACPDYGAAGIIGGSLVIVGLAIIIATPLALGAALFIEQTDKQFGDRVLRPVLEIFVGIPSVVYGWVGLTNVVPVMRHLNGGGTGLSVAAAALVLSIMILPTVTTLSADAIRNVHPSLPEASYALGATRWQTIWKTILPAARAGITTGIVLGVARALGEALAVAMVVGNIQRFPTKLFGPASTMTTSISVDLGNGALYPVLVHALYALGLLLLLVSLALIIIIRRVSRGFEAKL